MDLKELFPKYEFSYITGRMHPKEPIFTWIWVKDIQSGVIERHFSTKDPKYLNEDDHKKAVESLLSKIAYYEHRR